MKIVIKNPAPAGVDGTKWGDYHFGLSLQRALEKAGAIVSQHFWTEWDQDEQGDLVLVLRGKRRYRPSAGKPAMMWAISHPSTITLEEIESYNLVFVASEAHRRMLVERTSTSIRTLRQCTDTILFYSRESSIAERDGIVFVANSRGVQRNMLRWSMELGIRPKLIGRGWKSIGLGHWVAQEYVDNDKLPELYRSAALGLNDHWADMAHYGYISNRIFDCLACGLPVLSDDFPELREVCGDGLLYASDQESFHRALIEYALYYPDLVRRTKQLWDKIGSLHTFDAVAAQLMAEAASLPPGKPSPTKTRTPDLTALKQAYRAAIERLRRNGLTKAPKFLHLRGSEAAMEWLLEETDGVYLSGGFGAGPWHLELPETEPSAREERFDLIVVDDISILGDEPGQKTRLILLARRLTRPGGILVLSSSLTESCAGVLCSAGMKKLISENETSNAFAWP